MRCRQRKKTARLADFVNDVHPVNYPATIEKRPRSPLFGHQPDRSHYHLVAGHFGIQHPSNGNCFLTEPEKLIGVSLPYTWILRPAVLERRDILDYVECIDNDQWYEPPVSISGLAKSMRAAIHDSSSIYVKRNILVSTYIPHPYLSRQDFSRFALDYMMFGNAFI